MPSIPQSLLWISLVVLWLFVLVPMLINKRDTVRRTSDVALATRVINSAAKSRLIRRGGPAAGHRHDPEWRREEADFEAECEAEFEAGDVEQEAPVHARTRSVMVLATVTEEVTYETDYLDVDVVDENSGALPVGGGAQSVTGVQASLFDAPVVEPEQPAVADPEAVAEEPTVAQPVAAPVAESFEGDESEHSGGFDADEFEYIDDSSGLEAEDEPAPAPRRSRRDSSSMAEAVSARKYRFRKRVLTVLATVMVLTAVLSFTVSSGLWLACGLAAAVTVLYLAYLRRQTRIEEQVRRRRQQRTARYSPLEEAAPTRGRNRDFDVVPNRLQRPGAVVLDIDDEDPIFEHLDEVAYSRRYDLPRAAGQ
ncbi:MAG: divisome protein SepX/GlpR [Mycobacterium sp.]